VKRYRFASDAERASEIAAQTPLFRSFLILILVLIFRVSAMRPEDQEQDQDHEQEF
jgi:hypothetical protein